MKRKYVILISILITYTILNHGALVGARDENISGHLFSDTVVGGEGWVRYFLPDNNTYAITSDVDISNFTMYVDTDLKDQSVEFEVNHSSTIILTISHFSFSSLYNTSEYEHNNVTYYPTWNCYLLFISSASIDSLRISVPIGGNILPGDCWVQTTVGEEWNFLNTTEEDGHLCATLQSGDILYSLSIFSRENGTSDEPSGDDNPTNSNLFTQAIIITTSISSAIAIPFIILFIAFVPKSKYKEYIRSKFSTYSPSGHRLSIDEVLENENRSQIIDLILDEPGIHFNELLRKTELAPGNLVWHLDILCSYNVIGKKRIGQYLVYFPFFTSNPMSNLDIKLAKSKTTLEILHFIEEEPGTYASEIAKILRFDHKTVKYHVDKLLENGLIYDKKQGRKKLLYPKLHFSSDIPEEILE
ncbi:MAG: winged helix-turn-helix transcriptional regulator [Candidatus Hodarchaeota archaeon]